MCESSVKTLFGTGREKGGGGGGEDARVRTEKLSFHWRRKEKWNHTAPFLVRHFASSQK